MKKRSILIAFLVLSLLLPACGGSQPASDNAPPPAEDSAAQISDPASGADTPAPPTAEEPPVEEAPVEEPPQQPELLLTFLEEGGLALEDLKTRQLIVAKASGNEAVFYTFSADESGQWQEDLGGLNGHVGKNGVTDEKTEGDKQTPLGLYALPYAFGVEADPGCAMEYRAVTEESYWVDDADSVFYNQWVEGTADKDWDSAEHLSDYPHQYAYAMVVAYNTEATVPGAGSAIFLHCGDGYTAGCLSVPTEDMKDLLLWVQADCDPMILILGE